MPTAISVRLIRFTYSAEAAGRPSRGQQSKLYGPDGQANGRWHIVNEACGCLAYRMLSCFDFCQQLDFNFNGLCQTFGSMFAQRGVPAAVTQRLPEHSSPKLTNKVYTNVHPVLRHALGQLPAQA